MPSTNRHPYRDFVKSSFRASWEIELLLRLHQEPQREWRIDELAQESRIDSKTVATCVNRLLESHLISQGRSRGGYIFDVECTETRRLIDMMSEDFRRNRLAVLRILYS